MRKNLFCPNLSLKESKALIEKLGLKGFYKEYIKNNYNIPSDINEDISEKTIDELRFINKELFTARQQDEVVDSILYETQQLRLAGESNRGFIKNSIKNDYQETLDYFKSESDGSEDYLNMIDNLTNVINNFDSFYERVEKKLASQDVTVDTNSMSEANDEDSSYDSAENLNQKLNYSDDSNFKQSTKDTASANLKIALSLIPKYIYENGKIVLDEDGNPEMELSFIGSPTFESIDTVWNDLLYTLIDVPIGSKLNYLSNSINPRHNIIASYIKESPDTSLVNQFESVFSKQQANFVTVSHTKPDKVGIKSIRIMDTNRMNASNLLIDKWNESFNGSDLIQSKEGIKTVNTNKGLELLESYNKALEVFKQDNNKGFEVIKGLLDKVGINISLKALKSDGIYENKNLITPTFIIENKLNRIFDSLAGKSKTDITGLESLDINNPFIDENSTLELLAKLENKVNPSVFEASYISGDGKSKYSFVNNTYASLQVRKLKGDLGYLNKLKSTAYASGSVYLNRLITDPAFREVFDLKYVDSIGNDANNQTNKTFASMNTKEKELTKIGLFQNAGRGFTSNKTDIGQFIGLVPSDKTTTPLFTTLKVDVKMSNTVNADNNYSFNSETMEAIYTQFLAEYNRVKQTFSEIGNPNVNQILEYHTGAQMGRRFIIFPTLNKILIENNKLKNLDTDRLEELVKPELEKLLTQLTNDQLKYWKSLGIIGTPKDLVTLFDKSYAKKNNIKLYQPSTEETNKTLRWFASNYAVNQFIFMMNQTQLFSGDPALHGKTVKRDGDIQEGKSIDKTWNNFFKRMAKDIAPGTDGNFGDGATFNTIFLKDLNYESAQLMNYMEKVSTDIGKEYAKINPADAQEYTTLDEHAEVMRAYGRLDQKAEDALIRLKEGGSDINDIKLILQPMKPVYVTGQIEGGINIMYYIKSSSFPLIPAMTKGLEIDKLRQLMESNNIQRASYESAAKLGLQGSLVEVSNDGGIKFSDLTIDPKQIINLTRDGFRLQQEMPYHGDHPYINEGSQGRKLVLNNLPDTNTIKYNGKMYTGREVKTIFENLHIEKMNRSLDKLVKDLGFNEDGQLEDISKIQKLLQEEAESRDYPLSDIYSIQLIEENGKKTFKVPVSFTNNATRFESILNSVFTNRVIKSELPGFMGIQGASSGFMKVMTDADLSGSIIESGITWINPNDTKLDYIRVGENNEILSADILVPNYIRDKNGNQIDLKSYIKEDGTLDTVRIPKDILTVIGLRIPTQGYNSMMKFNVKGFLPNLVGDLVIVPAEVTIQMGSDFDVDKLFIYRYNYNIDKSGNVSKITTNLKSEYKSEKLEGTELVNFINNEASKISDTFKNRNLIGESRIKDYSDEDYDSVKTILNLYKNKQINLYNEFEEAVNENYNYDNELEEYSVVAKRIIDGIEYGNLNIYKTNTVIDYSKLSEEQIENLIIQTFEDRLSDYSLMDEILTPNGFGKLPEVASKVASLFTGETSKHIFSTREQNSISDVNVAGKMGTAVFSLFSTFFKASQDANLVLNGSLNMVFKDSQNKPHSMDDLSGLNSIEGDKRSNVIMYLQSAAVDNSKEQILGKLNINDYTMGVAGTMAMMGLSEDFIGYYLSQPILRQYVDKVSGSSDILAGNSGSKTEILNDLITNTTIETFKDSNLDDSTKSQLLNAVTYGSKELLQFLQDNSNASISGIMSTLSNEESTAIKNANKLFELKVLTDFQTFLNLADIIQVMQSATNADTKGLGSSYASVQAKTMQLQGVFKGIETGVYPIANLENLFNNNTVAKANEVIFKANSLLGNIYSYNSATYTNIIKEVIENSSGVISENTLKDIYSNIKSYLFTNPVLLNQEEIYKLRDSLLYGKDNIAQRWLDFSNTPEGKRNPITKRILPKFSKNSEDYNGLKALNTPASNNSYDIDTIIAYFYEMLNSSNTSERILAEDLVKYHILTGANFGPQSIGKYITFDVLERFDFSKKLRKMDSDMSNNQLYTPFVKQYFQNNPFKAITINLKEVYGLDKIPDTLNVIINNNPIRNSNNDSVKYFSTYDEVNRKPILYELNAITPDILSYKQIPVLGNKLIKKYDYLNTTEANISKAEEPYSNIDNPIMRALAEPIDTIESILVNSYGNNTVDILENISNSNNRYYAKLATDLLASNNLNNVNVEFSNGRRANGWYSNNTIYINPNVLNSNTNDLGAKFEEVFLHELIHAGTINALDNQDNLTNTQKIGVNKINRLYQEYVKEVENPDELTKYININNRRLSGDSISQEDMQFLTSNKGRYYALTSPKEFIAAGLTNPAFISNLKARSLWERFIDFIANIVGVTKNDLHFLYNATIETVGNNTNNIDINEDLTDDFDRLEFVKQRNEFLTNHRTSIGKSITNNTLKKFQESAKKSKYNRLNISSWNGELRVSRVYPTYEDISEEKPVEKEDAKSRAINSLLERFKESLKKFKHRKRQLGDEVDPVLDTKIKEIENKIKTLETEKSIVSFMNISANKLDNIATNIDSYDLDSLNDALSYTSALKNINTTLEFTSEFDEWNNKLDAISAKSTKLNDKLLAKGAELLSTKVKEDTTIDFNIKGDLSRGISEINYAEGKFLDYSQSSSEHIQILGTMIEKYQFNANQKHDEFVDEFIPLIEEFKSKYKNDYSLLLQKNKKGVKTGYLLNKYSQEFYDSAKGNFKFFIENTDVELTPENLERYEKDKRFAYDNLSPEDFLSWEKMNNPETYLKSWKKGINPAQQGARRYIKVTPKAKWIDLEYTKLKSLGENDPAVKMYEFIEPILRRNNKKYKKQSNFIPGGEKSPVELMLEGKGKEALAGLKEQLVDSFSTQLDSNKGDIDILTGENRLYIPVEHFGDDESTIDTKNLDLASITEKVRFQEITLGFKYEAEPVLNLYYAMLKNAKQFLKYDENGNPVTIDKRADKLLEQAQFLIQNYLYNVNRTDSDSERLMGKGTDAIISYARVVGMGWNPFSAVGNIMQGLTSNFTFADGRYFDKSQYSKASGIMLHSLAGNTDTAKKVSKLFRKFDTFVKTNELNYGKSRELATATQSKFKDYLQPYELQQRGEYFIQGQTMIGILLNSKFTTKDGKEISLYEGYDNNGTWKSEYGSDPMKDKKELFKMTQKIRKAIIDVHGNYARPISAKKDFYFRAVMMFRTWLPQAIHTRFGAERTDILLNQKSKGRYRSWNNMFKNKDGKFDLDLSLNNLKWWIGLSKNTSLTEMDKANMRRNLTELAMITAITLAIMALKAGIKDLDDEDKTYTNYVLNTLSRANSDLTFFMLPSSANTILQDPIPLMRSIQNTLEILPASWNYIIDEDEYKAGFRKGDSRLGKELRDVIPFVTQIDKNLTYMNQVFEK